MAKWKYQAIDVYRTLTRPLRGLSVNAMRIKGRLPVYSLFYHRVSNDVLNPWTITIDKFRQQMEWLKRNFDVVTLLEAQRRIASGFNNRPTVCITFDDGYSENGEFAIPYMIENRLPLTYFVATGNVVDQRPFEHDALRGEILPVDTIDNLRSYVAAGVEIGGHTRNHIDMGSIQDPATIVDEVLMASRELERLLDTPIRYFAFPFGQPENLNRVAFHLLKQHGFCGVCSAYGGWNEIGGDAFHIQRIHGDPSLSRVKNMLTVDPRTALQTRFDYSLDPADDHSYAILEETLRLAKANDSSDAVSNDVSVATLPPIDTIIVDNVSCETTKTR